MNVIVLRAGSGDALSQDLAKQEEQSAGRAAFDLTFSA
jgi:hypothetical protein